MDAVTWRRYDLAGFGRSLRHGLRPAVLVVDFSYGFTDPYYPTGADLSKQLCATAHLLEVARSTSLPIVFTTIAYEYPYEGGVWSEKVPGLAAMRAGSRLVQIDERLPRRDEDAVVVKKGPSAFFGTHLIAVLLAQQVDTLIVCGATTSGCVRASVVDAVSYGFRALVPRECVGDRAQGVHQASLFDIEQKYGDVVGLQETVEYVQKTSEASANRSSSQQ